MVSRDDKSWGATIFMLLGIAVIIVGLATTNSALNMPLIIAGIYLILGLFITVIGGLMTWGGYRKYRKYRKDYYVCGYCDKEFDTEQDLISHVLTHEKTMGEKSKAGARPKGFDEYAKAEKLKNETDEKSDSSLEILKKRYASGEISEDEFNKIKKDLE